jgi:hypothetical protein
MITSQYTIHITNFCTIQLINCEKILLYISFNESKTSKPGVEIDKDPNGCNQISR